MTPLNSRVDHFIIAFQFRNDSLEIARLITRRVNFKHKRKNIVGKKWASLFACICLDKVFFSIILVLFGYLY